jgi:membrane associated rhomboid family serine protease/Zn-finger nucleic acid-binding protein
MRCPRCTFPLVVRKHGGVDVDNCPRCHGAFFESGEAKQILGENAEPTSWERSHAATNMGSSKLECPAGHGALSAYKVQSPPEKGVDVEVDVCPTCLGMWLDAWEATRLQQATEKLVVKETERKPQIGWYIFQLLTTLPVEDYNPVRRRPVALYVVMLLCLASFAAQLVVGKRLFADFGLVPAQLHWYAIVTHMFLHVNVVHLLPNLYFLYVFGDNIEDRVGHVRFTMLFLVFGVAAALSQLVMMLGSFQPLVGASGAISGLMASYALLFPRTKVWVVWLFVRFKMSVITYFTIWVGLQAALAFWSLTTDVTVAFWAHLGGFGAGSVWGFLARKRFGAAD